ncbi:MAG: molybdopterin-guanine dinucleotide biosynthesis protein B [Casimicrobiaceae bacterium]
MAGAGEGRPRVFGFAGWSGAGKTTLIVKIIEHLAARGYKVSLIKHAHHDFDIDTPGKDSHRHRMAGAHEVLVSSRNRFALIRELRGAPELGLHDALERLAPCDLILIEGYKRERVPKMEVWRAEVGKPLLFGLDPEIIAVATDDPLADAGVRRFGLGDVAGISDFVLQHAAPVLRN